VSGTTGATAAFSAAGTAGTPSPLWVVGGNTPTDQEKVRYPDIIGNLRIDQAWGSAQIMGALHDASAGYYGNTAFGVACNGVQGTTCAGHPNDKMGFAIGGGIKINFPMIGPGDYFQAQVNYTQGAARYAAFTQPAAANPGIFGNSNTNNGLGVGVFSDAVYCGAPGLGATAAFGAAACPAGGSSVQLTTVWGVNAAYEHFWTPALRTSLVGGYTATSYNGAASQMLAASPCGGAGTQCGTGFFANGAPITSSNGLFDWQFYSISSRTQWNITKDFYVGLEGFYGHLNTMAKNAVVTYTGTSATAQPTSTRTLADQDVFVYRMRVHRDLVP